MVAIGNLDERQRISIDSWISSRRRVGRYRYLGDLERVMVAIQYLVLNVRLIRPIPLVGILVGIIGVQ